MKRFNVDKEVSERIWVTRYIMIIGIIILHLPPYLPLQDVGTSGFDYIKAFFTYGVFRATVPVLTVMSGYLIFQSGLHLKPKKLVTKKINSLLIPLILWNLPLVIAIFMVQKYAIFSHDFSAQLHPFELINWISAATGYDGSPINYPTNFLRDIFVLSLLSPLIWQLLKVIPYAGLVLVLVIYYFNLDGNLIHRNSMLVSFYIGALAAHTKWNLRALDKYAPILLILFLTISITMVLFKFENREPLRLIAPFLVWPAISLLVGTKVFNFILKHSKNSFFTFLSHGPIILILWLIYQKLFPNFPYFIYWFTAPVITIMLTVFINGYFRKLTPKLHAIALGNR